MGGYELRIKVEHAQIVYAYTSILPLWHFSDLMSRADDVSSLR
jgi:hypothetical protein